jgi:two-component system, sensor histidine kinase and response regulator
MNIEDRQSLRPNVLIVDDTPANLRLLSQMLGQQGYKVRVANDGRHALESIHANPPDLILLDIMMPGMDGYQVCEQVKRTSPLNTIPVIFLSALDASLDKVKAFAAGGVDYITKPFQLEEVLARVAAHLGLRDLQRQLEAQNLQLAAEIAERERAQTALRQYANELEASNAELDAFAHTVAHDLKNPLAAVLGFSTLLELRYHKMPAQMVEENMHRVTLSAHKMTSIINELLLLASVRKMEDVECGPLDMAHIVAEASGRLATLVESTGATLIIPETWPTAYGYAPWVEEVWVNYLSNALKYGGRPEEGAPPHVELGFSTFGLETPPDAAVSVCPPAQFATLARAEPAIVFWVHDNGPGIPHAEQQRLFAEFQRLAQTRLEGHGLGLSIVRRIVEKLQGVVGVESAVGRGSTFWFTLLAV